MILPTGGRRDPARGYNFAVNLIDSANPIGNLIKGALGLAPHAGFSEASGLEISLEIEEYKEGGRNDAVRIFPSRVTWSHLRLKRGIAVSDDLWNWHYGFVEGRGTRRDGLITLRNDDHEAVRAWRFVRGLPVKWTGPTLNATNNDVAFEEIEIAHEGLELVATGSLLGAVAQVVSGAGLPGI